jgi:hypothetical protein
METMALTLDVFAASVREILAHDNTPGGRKRVADLLRTALADPGFVDSVFAAGPSERRVVYEDPDYGFCIVAHEYLGANTSKPHDHGPSWAIYGQAVGETIMTDYDVVQPPTAQAAGKVRPARSYSMKPGDAHVYNEGDVHAPRRNATTRLVRIEGRNMAGVARTRLELMEG